MVCGCCNIDKPESSFRKRFRKDGSFSIGKICFGCSNKQYRQNNFFINRLSVVKRRAISTGVPFNLTKEDIVKIWTGKCAISGKILSYETNDYDTSPQLDRIIPEFGYVVGNVCWLSAHYNRLKSDLNIEDAKLILEWLIKQEELKNEKNSNKSEL